jgi:hypothetical protein
VGRKSQRRQEQDDGQAEDQIASFPCDDLKHRYLL